VAHSISSFADAFSPAFAAGDPTYATKSLEAANVACAQAFYRALALGDYQDARTCLTPDIAFQIVGPHALPSAGTAGLDQVMAQVQANFEAIASDESAIETMVAQGDTILAIARDRGHFRATGAPYHLQLVMHFTFRDRHICRFRQWLFPLG
jgi:uncharacterized protein